MTQSNLIFIVNPGSASRKYALFRHGKKIASLFFELVDDQLTAVLDYNGNKIKRTYKNAQLRTASRHVLPLLHEYKLVDDGEKFDAIGIRIVAPSVRFTRDHLITLQLERELDSLRQETPLHIQVALIEIKQLRAHFHGTPIIAVSDSAFHTTQPDYAHYYGVDTKLVKKLGIERYGYHGISVGSIVDRLKRQGMLMPKTIVCHLGSGSSVTAVLNGKSIDNTMGYSPLEGLMMATRSGSIDPTAALVIRHELNLTDNGLEQYLDKKSGLLGVSGSSSDIRQLLESEANGDERAHLALDMFVYRVQQAIGQMAASLAGANCLVFTGTVGERSYVIRERIMKRLEFLGFECDKNFNNNTYEPTIIANIASNKSKPILVVATDEMLELNNRTVAAITKH